MEDTVDVVVAYYWSSPQDAGRALVDLTTELSLLLLKDNPVVGEVVLVDGSPTANDIVQAACARQDATYLHLGRELSLPEAYNVGWRSLTAPYVALMANDILPYPPETMAQLLEAVKVPDVGCTFPYLSEGFEYTQHVDFSDTRTRRTCEPASMTLNLNVFKRLVLEGTGGVADGYLVGYYDPILLMGIRRLGYRVVLVGGAKAIHYDSLTKRAGGSALSSSAYHADTERWMREYPRYAVGGGIGNLSFWRWPCATTPSAAVLWWASEHFPVLRRQAHRAVMRIEPYLTAYPARHGTRPRRAT